jgi:hypothetical protein
VKVFVHNGIAAAAITAAAATATAVVERTRGINQRDEDARVSACATPSMSGSVTSGWNL